MTLYPDEQKMSLIEGMLPPQKVALVVETAALSAAERGEYCRK